MPVDELTRIDSLIAELNTKKDVAERLLEEVDAIKAVIRDKLIERGLSNLTTKNHTISYSECQRTSVDKKRLQSEFPELFGQLAKVSRYRVLRIS
ncbi:MAG: hypothetical protein IJH37_12780 [Clostridia bacterium]|nr:hypothetical protein [Clostridia bacterium]